MKKVLGIILAMILAFSSVCVFATDNDAVIINASDWAIEEVTQAYDMGLIPEALTDANLTENVTRAEFTAIALTLYEKLIGEEVYVDLDSMPFDDIDKSPYVDDIITANHFGITNGTSENTFSPDALITREQMATMIVRALNSAQISTVTESVLSFADGNNISEYAKDAVRFMSDKGIIKGVGDNKFAPKATATREQAILIAYRCANEFKEDTSKATLGNILKAEFEKIANSGNVLQIAEKLAANDCVNMLSMGAMRVEQGFLAGFDNTEITGFSDGAMFAPMIGTIPFVGYVFTLESESDIDAFIKKLEESANLRWNICTMAEEMVTGKSGNKVFFVMCNSSIEE